MTGYWTLVTPPVQEPVSQTEAKLHLRVEHEDENTLIDALIAAARQHVEAVTGRALLTQTWDLVLPGFPLSGVIELPKAPLQSVTSITYVDPDGVLRTLDPSQYLVQTPAGPHAAPGRITRPPNVAWPATEASRLDAVMVRFVAGYGSSGADVPEAIRQALLLLIGHWYENREAVSGAVGGAAMADVPFGAEALLTPYRLIEVA